MSFDRLQYDLRLPYNNVPTAGFCVKIFKACSKLFTSLGAWPSVDFSRVGNSLVPAVLERNS